METVMAASQDCFSNETTVPTFVSIKKSVDTRIICKTITETSSSYNTITLFDGKYILLTPCETHNNINMELKTYVEVKPMNSEIKNKINCIYSTTIQALILLIIFSLINIAFNILSIPTGVLLAIIFFSIIGALAFMIDRHTFNRTKE